MEATALPTTPPARPALRSLADFSDRLSPMLVKELRQGMRSKIFVGLFLLLHSMLVITVLPTLFSGNSRDSSIFFWVCVGIGLAVLLPLTGMNAIHEERQTNTLDTLVLTRLSSWRIVLGKWASMVVRILLLGVTLLPYIVLRYFGGGVNIPLELGCLAFVCLLGIVGSALTVAFSAQKFLIIRGLLTLGVAVGAFTCVIGLASVLSNLRYRGGSTGFEWFTTSWFLVTGVFLTYYFLEIGAASIAPASENRTTLRRFISLAYVILCLVGIAVVEKRFFTGGDTDAIWACLATVVTLICIDAMVEPIPSLSIIREPFLRRGILGKIAYFFTGPGWHTGVLFSSVLILLVVRFPIDLSVRFENGEEHAYGTLLLAQMVFGVLVVTLLKKKNTFVMFWIVQAICLCLFVVVASIADSFDERYHAKYLFPMPMAWFSDRRADAPDVVSMAHLFLMIYGSGMLILAVRKLFSENRGETTAEVPEHPNAR